MISKAKSCPGGTALFQYVVNDKKGYELMRNNLSGLTPKDMYSNMAIIQNQNLRCKNNTFSIVLSPTIEDGKKLSDQQLKEVTKDFLKEMNLKSSQFIAFIHDEKDHKHIHIILNRVNLDGSLINDSFISKRAQQTAHKIAQKHQLISAKDLKKAKEKKQKEASKDVIKQIRNANRLVMNTKPKNLLEYMEKMKHNGVEVKPTINKQGNIQGFQFIHIATGTNLKASQVDRKLKLNKLFSTDSYNRPLPKTLDESIEISTSNESEFKKCCLNINLLSALLREIGSGYENDDLDSKDKRRRKGRKR